MGHWDDSNKMNNPFLFAKSLSAFDYVCVGIMGVVCLGGLIAGGVEAVGSIMKWWKDRGKTDEVVKDGPTEEAESTEEAETIVREKIGSLEGSMQYDPNEDYVEVA